ncbi:MAG: hypothetical protein K0B09_14940 [Bacteroidales bacterium]|nr:hypothetical protein [Bacteroidales bacterium]
MIIYSNNNIHKWAWWRKKSKFLFCVSSGLVFGTGVTLLTLILKLLREGGMDVTNSCLAVFGGSFVAGALFSIILWYQNDDRYREYLRKKQTEE